MDETAAAPGRRRRRRHARRPGDAVVVQAPESPEVSEAAEPVDPAAITKPHRRRGARDASAERGLRDIVGAGRSQLGVSGALRARDVNRPTAQDLAEAERDVDIVRRNWKPPG
jgi:hypothetical protein